ncbi:MAG: hypothetical protein V2I25_01345 [Woeseiaceae bacterium]|jgi:hypothetical protein|nr:hypothetical protein [Woeseiaceae bacterium]
MRKIILILIVLVVGVPFGFRQLMTLINTSTITADQDEIAAQLEDEFRIAMPPGYKGAFGMQVGFFGVQGANIVALVPQDADPEAIFEGGRSVKFSPGEHTIALAIRTNSGESKEHTYRDLQRFALGDKDDRPPLTEVFIQAGDRRVAAYEQRDVVYGQDTLGYFIFLDNGGLVFVVGPAEGLDHAFKTSLASQLSAAYPANELLYAHVEQPTRDASHPCGLGELPERIEVHAIGIRRGDHDLPGVAIDPRDDSASEQSVAVGRTEAPVVLVLMSAEPTLWKVLSTPEADIAGVLATGDGLQRVIGLEPGVPLKEIDPNARNSCRSFHAYEDRGRQFDDVEDRVFEIFAQSIEHMHTVHGGNYFRIGEMTAEPVLRGSLTVEDIIVDPTEQVLPGKLGLTQLKEAGTLEIARPSDLDRWLGGFAAQGIDAERYRRRLSMNFNMERVFIIKAATELPSGMYGAHSAVFLVDAGVPEPGGDRAHNTLVFADGRCVGTVCP